ncbi:MAG: phage adaptor protein, partial [Halioglobus sp.]
LKTAIANWLDRSDLTPKIPEFIQLAENKIFRTLRCPGNEQWVTYPADPLNAQTFQVPNDFLEAKVLMFGTTILERITDQRYLFLLARSDAQGTPRYFTRMKDQFYLYPQADTEADMNLIYWESQGPMVADTDQTRVLAFAPDLYLYGALTQAQAYLIGDERLGVWAGQYNEAMAEVMSTDNEVDGSTVTISSIYGG